MDSTQYMTVNDYIIDLCIFYTILIIIWVYTYN
jgi:hypothetical protein